MLLRYRFVEAVSLLFLDEARTSLSFVKSPPLFSAAGMPGFQIDQLPRASATKKISYWLMDVDRIAIIVDKSIHRMSRTVLKEPPSQQAQK